MILTPLSASVSQFTDGDTVNTNSLGFLIIGTNGMPGTARAAKVDDSQRLHVDGSGVTQPISVASLPLPTGASTAANQATLNTVVKNEDAAHGSGDAGIMALAVRNDAGANLTSTDGDYSPIAVNSAGMVIAVINTSSGFGLTALKNEDDAMSSGAAGYHLLGVRRDTDGVQTSASGDYESLQTDSIGRLKAQSRITDGGTNFAAVTRAATFDANNIAASVIGLTVNSRAHQIYSISHPDNAGIGGDDTYYAQNMDTFGNLCANLSAIGGITIRPVNGAGTQPKPLPMGGVGRNAPPTAVTNTRAQELYLDLNGRVCTFSDQATPAGNNNIGDVDILSVIPGTAATNLGKAEDAVHGTGDTGVMMLGVRADTLVAKAGTDGDYEPIPIGNFSSTVGVATHIVGSINLQVISDVANAAALNSNSALPIAGPDVSTGNKGNIESAAAAVTTTTARGAVVRHVGVPAAAALSDSISNPTTVQIGSALELYNGSTWERFLAARNALNSTGVGVPNAALVGQLDDTSPTTITENQFGHIRITPRRALMVGSEISSRVDTYTTTANGTTVDLGAGSALKNWTIQVVQTGTVTSWDIRLEGSLDGTNFDQIIAHTNTDGSGKIKAQSLYPVRYFRTRCAGIVLGVGTNVVANILGSE